MRIPLAVDLDSRDGTLDQDALVKNGLIESRGDSGLRLRKRPALAAFTSSPTSGTAQGFSGGLNLLAVIGDKLCWLSSRTDNYMDPAFKGANITLSNNNLTVSGSGAGQTRCAIPTTNASGFAGGVAFAEVTIGSAGGGQRIGISAHSMTATNAPGADTTSGAGATAWDIAYDVSDGKVYCNNAVTATTGSTATAGDVIGVAIYIDRATSTTLFAIKWFKNGTLIHTEATNASTARGVLFYGYLVVGTTASGGSMTVNFGASPFSYTIPTNLECAIPFTTASRRRCWIGLTGQESPNRYVVVQNELQIFYSQHYMTPAYGTSGTNTFLAVGNLTGPFAGGIVYLDGYLFVMDSNGKISNSGSQNITFGALDYVYANAYPGRAMYLGKTLQYIVALKEWSIEWFYNAGNATGSVLASVKTAAKQVGCVDQYTVADVADSLVWVSRETSGKRGIHRLRGLDLQKISTPAVDKILELSAMTDNNAMATTVDGRGLYVLTIGDLGVTLVYDESVNMWTQWTFLAAGSNKSVSIIRSGTTATVTTTTAHGMSDGDPVTIAGANQSDYNGTFQISYIDSTSFKIEVSNSPTTPATGTITATPYTEGEFPAKLAVNFINRALLLTETGSLIRELSSTAYMDATSVPINYFARTIRLDGGNQGRKTMARIGVVGDDTSDSAMLRWSDDDSGAFTKYRRVTLSDARPSLRRCGGFERRSIEFRHVGNTAPAIDALELEIGGSQ